MKSKKIELDVDIIGNQEPLTEKEIKAISDYIRKRKKSRKRSRKKKTEK